MMNKKTAFRITATAMVLILLHFGLAAQAISGNGKVVREERTVGSFTGIVVSSGIDLAIEQGAREQLEIETDENLQEYIISEVRGDDLHIYVRRNTNIRQSKAMIAYVTVEQIGKINVSGGGDVAGRSPITTDELSIVLSGGGDLSMELKSDRVSCNISGGGDAELSGNIRDLKTQISGGGDLELDAALGTLDLNLSGGGDAEIRGGDDASLVSITLSGGGDLEMDVACNEIRNTVSGGGDVQVSAGNRVSKASFASTGGGDLNLNLRAETLDVSVGGGGDASLRGSAGNLACEMNSGGDLDAGDFNADRASLNLTGGSDAHIRVEQALTVNASGGGQIYVSGNPQIVANLSGGSKVHSQ